jgi:hypothetical protein
MVSDSNKPCVIFTHTNATIKAGMKSFIDQNDVRNTKTLVNISEFFYVLQTFVINSNVCTTIRVTKHRGTDIGHKMYGLDYCGKTRTYFYATAMDYKKIKVLFDEHEAF